MSRDLVPPRFSVPPGSYDAAYFADMVRSLTSYIIQMQQPGDIRATTGTFTALPTTDVALEQGGLFEVGGFVKVSQLHMPYVAGLGVTASAGTVTVSTP